MTEAFDLMSNSIFDNIIMPENEAGINLDDIWKTDISNMNINSFPLIPSIKDFYPVNKVEMDSNEIIDNPKGQPSTEILRHDCMWSGTCVDPAHPSKKKNFRFCMNEDEIRDDSELDLETELTLENNLPSLFQSFKNDPAGMFQEIVQNATQSSRSASSIHVPRPKIHQFTQLQQTYNSIPIMSQNFVTKNSAKSNAVKLIKIENDVKLEPITVEHVSVIPSVYQDHCQVQQVFFCNEAMPIVPYYPQVKYEHVNAASHPFTIHYPTEHSSSAMNNGIQDFMDPTYGYKNFKVALDRKKQRYTKKKSQGGRKGIKKPKMRGKTAKIRLTDDVGMNGRKFRALASPMSDENPIEKRNMHNSMERQRRIGLKNLFVELKQAIPALDEKERVPKVSILREAIHFCQKLSSDEQLLDDLKKRRNKLIAQYQRMCKMTK